MQLFPTTGSARKSNLMKKLLCIVTSKNIWKNMLIKQASPRRKNKTVDIHQLHLLIVYKIFRVSTRTLQHYNNIYSLVSSSCFLHNILQESSLFKSDTTAQNTLTCVPADNPPSQGLGPDNP